VQKTRHIATVSDYNAIVDLKTQHPLVSVIDFSTLKRRSQPAAHDIQAISFGFYAVFLKDQAHCDIRYGRSSYDYQEGTLLFIAPDQVVSIAEDDEDYAPSGYVLLFHPHLLKGTSLGRNISNYSFFSYTVREALHLSDDEQQMAIESFEKIRKELHHGVNKHSQKLIVANIELFLDYCVRFYDRQFISRDHDNVVLLHRFDDLLNDYFAAGKAASAGLPSVAYFAEQFHVSPNYFGDLVKKKTGKTALECIQQKLLSMAKEKLFDPAKSLSEVAYEMGFAYPQHFTRFFKQHAGQTPTEYRVSISES